MNGGIKVQLKNVHALKFGWERHGLTPRHKQRQK